MKIQKTARCAVVAGLTLAMTAGPGSGVAYALDAMATQVAQQEQTTQQDQKASTEALAAAAIGEQPTITGMEQDGFAHPSIGFSKESLELMQTKLREGYDPWVSALNTFAQQANAALDYQTRNSNPADPTKPLYTDMAGDAQAREGKVDGNAAWCQAVMYVATGNVQYRKNCMDILRKWAQVRQTTNAFSDSHISSSEAVYPMVRAAEIMRYTSAPADAQDLAWTQTDTDEFTGFLESLRPHKGFYHVNTRHMNQQSIANRLYLAIAIFENNEDYYKEAVEWTLANKTYVTEDGGVYGRNGALYIQVRNVNVNAYSGEELTPHYQVSEMGRDQFHPKDGLDAITAILQAMTLQGTKVNDDPTSENFGEVDANGVTPFEFMGNRLLKGYNQLSKYNLGYDINWTPIIADEKAAAVLPTYSDNGVATIDANGNPSTPLYYKPSTNGRGGLIYNSQLIAHYTFDNTSEGWESQDTCYLKEAFDRAGGQYDAETVLVDGNEAMTGEKVGQPASLPSNPYAQNQAAYDRNQFFNYYGRSGSVSTNTYSDDDGTRSVLYDVKGSGQYTWYKMHFDSDVDHITAHLASKANGAKRGTLVDVVLLDDVEGLDEKNVTSANIDAGKKVATIVMPDTGSWTNYYTASQPLQIMDKDTGNPTDDTVNTIAAGDHIVAFRYYDNYGNGLKYQIAADWFTFSKHYANQTNAATAADALSEGAKKDNGAVTLASGASLSYQDMNYDNGVGAATIDYAAAEAGALSLKVGDKVVATYSVAATDGARKTASFALPEGVKASDLTGRKDVALEWTGNQPLTLYSYENVQVPYTQAKADSAYEFEDHALADEKRGSRVVKAADGNPGYLELDDGSYAIVNSPSLTAGQISLRVKSNGMAALELLKESNSAEPYLTVYVPDTQGEWRDVVFDLSGVSYNGSILYMQMKSLSGDATKVQLDSKQNEPANKAPQIAAETKVSLGADGSASWDLKASDAENDDLTFALVGDVPEGVTLDGSTLKVAASASGARTAYVQVSDGHSLVVKKFEIPVAGDIDAQIAAFEQQVGDTSQYTDETATAYEKAMNDLKQANARADKKGIQDALKAVKTAVAGLKQLNVQLADGTLDYIALGSFSSSSRDAANTKKQLQNLVDGNNDTCSDFRKSSTDGNGKGGWFTIDFGEGYGVKADSFYLHCRTKFGFTYPEGGKQQNRFKHAYVEGSNDGKNWTRLTEEVPDKVDEATLANGHADEAFRYLRFASSGSWYGNLGEMRINGSRVNVAAVETNELQSLTVASSNVDQTKAKVGDTVTVSASFKDDVKQAAARINGEDVEAKIDGKTVTAVYTVTAQTAPGSMAFSLDVDGTSAYASTDGSAVTVLPAQNATQVAAALKSLTAPALGSKTLALPQVPGFDVSIASSSDEDVLALDGTWTASDEARDVTVTLTVTSKSDPTDTATTGDITVMLPARADTSKLKDSLRFTDDLSERDLATIKQAIDEANAVLADPNASELDIALTNLKLIEAIHGLNTSRPDHEMLRQLADASKSVYDALDAEYADGTDKDAFKAAYDKAVDVLDDAMSSAKDIQSSYLSLKDAVDAIADDKLDSSELRDIVDAYASVTGELSGYTEKSGKAFSDAMAKAQDVLKHPGSQDAIDNAVKSLKDAFNGLVRKADADALDAAIKHAESFLGGGYTADSLAGLKDAIAAAKNIAADADATAEDGTAAVRGLYDAVKALVPLGSGTNGSGASGSGADSSRPGKGTDGASSALTGATASTAKRQKGGKLAETGDRALAEAAVPAAGGILAVLAGVAAFFKRRRDDVR